MQDQLDRLCARVLRHTEGLRLETPLPGVGLAVQRQSSTPVLTLYQPMACLVLQGVKQVLIGDRVLRYDPASCFIASLDLPASGCVVEAAGDKPYVVASLALNREVLATLLAELPPVRSSEPVAGFGVAPVTPELLAAWEQLLALLDTPQDIPFLAAAREREVLYRFLQGAHGPMLRQLVHEDSRLAQVRRAILWLRDHFDQPIRTETLAGIAGMSVPSFHRHFKSATAMSPLQYQKALRLQTARRLMSAHPDAARTAYAVGYESASQFSRDYARQFGAPPLRDAERLRAQQGEDAVV
jgi:AraC-like DNA-binding protein